ncbi:hypothetical protein GCM10008927_16250 [Amylibacter ulvae]|uniref:Hemin uptake protein HemP n=1 Tax=Paramylibacter ulvae TaxID=1651968 RepID=A0ABQ3D3Q5_9RHOB|nr:hemin uptake protein HemP [Amylibacter ulvae]GHA51582.1 hypothetical protein GCM10008927_16250 [Amylibacter ulvae]
MSYNAPHPIKPAQSTDIQTGPTFNVEHLLGENNTVQLVLDHQVYTLRKTRQNKLLLTK